MSIHLISRDDGSKAIQLKNHGGHSSITDVHDFTLGTLNNGTVQVGHHDEFKILVTISIPMTEAEHADITEFKKVTEVSRVAGEPHTSPKPLSERFGILTDLVTGILARVKLLEAMFPPPIVYRGWVVEGQELRLNLDGSDGDDCIIGVHNGFGGLCPARIAGQPANSSERMLTIEVNGAKHLLHIFSRGDTGRMQDAIKRNSSTQTIGTPPPAPTEEA